MASEVIPVAGMMVPVAIVGTVLTLKHLGRRREMIHRERMKAIEYGVPHRRGDAWRAMACAAIGAGVPVGSFLFAWLTNLTTNHNGEEAFVGATIVSIVAVISGGRLARLLLANPAPAPEPPPSYTYAAYGADGKPATDPDAYDVVGRRG